MEDTPDVLKTLKMVKSEKIENENGTIIKRKSLEDLIKEDARSPRPLMQPMFSATLPPGHQNSFQP